jgi:hypothetical protein
MPTARTYDKYSLAGEPFEENKRMYVYVMMPNGKKKVRGYTEAERAAQDRKAGIEPEKKDSMDFDARHAFGFGEKGYITIYKGDKNLVERWAENDRTNIWRNLTFGYYTPSQFPTPEVLTGIEPIQLKWEQVMDHDDRMKPHEEVAKLVNNLISVHPLTSNSTYQGQENAWLEKEVTIKENFTREDHFGEKHTYFMRDAEGNTYIWETGAKNLEVGMVTKLKMKVKAHKEINGEKCTVVWYCKIV